VDNFGVKDGGAGPRKLEQFRSHCSLSRAANQLVGAEGFFGTEDLASNTGNGWTT
jgi:hypothetical protein